MRLAISTVFNILCTQPGQRRGSTTPQELQDMTPTEQVGTPSSGREGGGEGSLVYTLLSFNCKAGWGRWERDC